MCLMSAFCPARTGIKLRPHDRGDEAGSRFLDDFAEVRGTSIRLTRLS